jgi:hypothetical protein
MVLLNHPQMTATLYLNGSVNQMHRIYFDTNEGSDGGYGLWLGASKDDLALIPDGPQEGMHVVIYMTGELEMEAILSLDHASGAWLARPISGTTRYLDQ